MRLGLACKLVILAFAAAHGSAGAMATEAERIGAIAVERCSTCHGPSGQGSNSLFPKLSGQNAAYLIQQMFNFKSGARKSTVMAPQLADLTGNDIVELAHHFSRQQLIPDPTPDQALTEAGRSLYMQGNPQTGVSACAACHGPKARGGQMLPRLAGQHAEYLETQLRHFIERSRTTDQTLMHSVASKMTGDELRAVSYFLSGLD
jgi:cytochrome c553